MGKTNFEIHIVLDTEGISCVQILGSAEKQEEGHALYFKIRDLVTTFDKEVQERLQNNESISTIN